MYSEMKIGHNIFILSAFAAIYMGCKGHDSSQSETIVYSASVDTVASLDMCVYPIQIEKMNNCLVILDIGNNIQCLSAYSPEGKLLRRFGNIGKAANEVNEVSHFFRVNDSTISVHKPGGILYYYLNDIYEANCNSEMERIDENRVSIHDIYADSTGVLCLSNSDEERFSYTDSKGNRISYNSYPSGCVDYPGDEQAVFNYAIKYGVDMDNKRFCVGTYIGGVLETFQISAGGFEPLGVNKLFESKYTKFDNGAVSWNEESRMGFDAICAEKNKIYTLLSGAKGALLKKGEHTSFTDKITVFNWDATIHSEIHIGHNMLSMCVSEERKEIYAICYRQSGNFYLIHATW